MRVRVPPPAPRLCDRRGHRVFRTAPAGRDDAAGLQQAKKSLGQFPNAKKVSGIGSLAYESTGGNPVVLNFVVGKDVVDIGLQTKQPLKSLAALNTLAKLIAGKL
jgi:hypothetical protein